jgi:hypothetical protein
VPTDTEPWIVITPQGAIARVRRQAARPFVDDGDGTPADGTAPPAPLAGPSFVAGELEVPAERSQVTPRPELATGPTPAVEVDLPEEVFVAAGQLLGPPGARAGVDKKTGAK